jgi:Protein of unknown function (DUF3349)
VVTVAATSTDKKAPTRLSIPAKRTATLGLRAPVAIEVAMALPVSWNPLVKSNASAVATSSTRMISSALMADNSAGTYGDLLKIGKTRPGVNLAIPPDVLGVLGLFTPGLRRVRGCRHALTSVGRRGHCGEGDAVNRFLSAIVSWLRAGYPEGVPPIDYMPVLALLSRRLTTDEVKTVASELVQRGDLDDIDIGVAITQITDELPSQDDIERVRQRLAAKGWPLDDPRDGGGFE